MAVTNLTGTKWLLPENLNSTSSISGDFDIDISPYEVELNTLLKLHYSSGEFDSITTWEGLLDVAPYLIADIGGTNVVNNLVVEDDKNNYLIVPTRGYLKIYSSSDYLYYGLDLASADNLPVVSGTLTFEHPIDGTVSLNFVELFHLFFDTGVSSSHWSEIPILGTIADLLFSTMTITGGDDVTNPTLIAWLEANVTKIKTISDKLQDLIDIKQDIKEAIENKDVDLTYVDFGGYAGEIDELPAVVELTQAQYNALSVYDNNTYYLIVED